ncbi:hypothetical protein BC834DRAFT_912375 [Gloeopeniophorella convolvens]|nr:hypothetical protein BC834DRAFT_912375 [Gloeopeniophorella convolvens]
MIYYLLRSRTGIRRTDSALNLLAYYCINCGILNMASSTCCLVTFVAFPKTQIHFPFFFVEVQLYFLSFVGLLNSREAVRRRFRGSRHGNGVTLTQFKPYSTSAEQDPSTLMAAVSVDDKSHVRNMSDGIQIERTIDVVRMAV